MPTPPGQTALVPILVGVTGKRTFDSKDSVRNDELRSELRRRFAKLVRALDAALPHTPKVLLCGGAAGADLDAARVVLAQDGIRRAHPGWSVVLVLPLEPALFTEDFAAPAMQADLAYLHSLQCDLAVPCKYLRPLLQAPFDSRLRLEPAGLARVPDDVLSRHSPAYDRQERQRHYEQFGLWLARTATILVAAGPAEPACSIGGTARVVAHRRTAMPDEAANQVIARSSELLASSPFEEPDGAHVLWLDPTQPEPHSAPLACVTILRPAQLVSESRNPKAPPSKTGKTIFANPFDDPVRDSESGGMAARGRGALALAGALDRMHARRRKAAGIHASAAEVAGPEAEHPAAYLERVRKGTMNTRGTDAAGKVRFALRACAVLFLAAVAAYEAYIEVLPGSAWPLALYLLPLGLIWGIAEMVRHRKIQLRAEDYRGVLEVLRVQIAWWSAGIGRPADRVHLRNADTDLRLVREAAALVSSWAVLRSNDLKTLDAVAVPRTAKDHPDPARFFVGKWIKDQANYFATNAAAQFGAKRLAELSFQVTFIAAAVALLALIVVLHWETFGSVDDLLAIWSGPALSVLPAMTTIAALGVAWLITGEIAGKPEPSLSWPLLAAMTALALCVASMLGGSHRDPAWLGLLVPAAWTAMLTCLTLWLIPRRAKDFDVQELSRWGKAVAALFLALLLWTSAAGLTPLLTAAVPEHDAKHAAEPALHKLVLILAVLLLAGSGMVRWYTERRNHLAQAAHYDDMLRTFRRAQDWLAQQPAPFGPEALEHLVELGEMALDENEAWLKAHRERPAEPIAGA